MKIPFRIALALTLPLWVFMVFILSNGYYRAYFEKTLLTPRAWKGRLTLLDWQFLANDTLHMFLQGFYQANHGERTLQKFYLDMSSDDYTKLRRSSVFQKSQYVRTRLTIGSKPFEVRTRNRGGHAWHYDYPKKSWRIKFLDPSTTHNGTDEFDLIAPKTLLPIEPLMMSWAKRIGLLVPTMLPAELHINGKYNGLTYFSENLNSNFFARNNRPNGTLYGIDGEIVTRLPARAGISSAWEDPFAWLILSMSRDPEDRPELQGLVKALNGSVDEFFHYATQHIDVDSYLKFFAFDSLMGVIHHDASANIKYFFDYDKARWVPVPWDFFWLRGAGGSLFTTLHPLALKFYTHPHFLNQYLETLWQLNKALPLDDILDEFDSYLSKIKPSLLSDPNRMGIIELRALNYLNIFFVERGVSLEKIDIMTDIYKNVIRLRRSRVSEGLSQTNLGFRVSPDRMGSRIDLACLSWSGCLIKSIKFKTIKKGANFYRRSDYEGNFNHKAQLIGHASRGQIVVNHTILPGVRLAGQENLKMRVNVLFPTHEGLYPVLALQEFSYVTDSSSAEVDWFEVENPITRQTVRIKGTQLPVDGLLPSDATYPWRDDGQSN